MNKENRVTYQKKKKKNRVIISQYTRSVLAMHQTKEKYSSQLNLTNLRRNGYS